MSADPKVLSRLPALTGMRILAAASVFLVHASLEPVFADENVTFTFGFLVGNAGYIGVGFFFLLSGFVLTWTSRPSDRPSAFWRRRFFKIAPNHVVAFAVALGLLFLAGRSTSLKAALGNFLLYQAWIPDIEYVAEGVNGVLWTLSVEFLFYLSFPLLIIPLLKVPASKLWYVAGAMVGGVFLMPAISWTMLPNEPHWPLGPISFLQAWFVYFFPVSRLFEFMLGMVIARIVMAGRFPRIPLSVAGILAVLGYGASLFAPDLLKFAAANVITLGILLGAVATADIKDRKTWLATRPMVFLGEVSFAFYLIHFLVINYGHLLFGQVPDEFFGGYTGPAWSTPKAIVFLLGAFAVAVFVSWLFYAFVEKPAMRRWSRGKPKQVAPAPEPERELIKV